MSIVNLEYFPLIMFLNSGTKRTSTKERAYKHNIKVVRKGHKLFYEI